MNQTIKLDTRKRDGAYGEARIAPLRRGERNNALLTVKVCANGQPYDLAGKTASLVATTAAGKLVGPCPMEVADEGIARIMLPAALYSAVGSFRGYVEIREGDTLVDTTDRFGGKVIECADLDSEQAAEFTPLLGELQNAVAEEAKRVEAEKARAQAETKRDEAEKKRVKAEEKRAQDSKTMLEELAQAKTNAETATGEANAARDEAKRAATDATSAAGKATDAAGLAETAKTNANTAAEEANAAATKAEAAARKADGAAETAGTAASTAAVAANKADTAAGNAEIMAEKADASANNADIAAGKANEATVAATNAATKANEVEAKLTGNILKGKVKETFVHVDDAFPSTLLGIEIEGACRQDGTPSPDNPVPIEVVENPVVKVAGRNLLHYTDYAGGYNLQVGIKLDSPRTNPPLVFNGEDAYAEATSHDWECRHIFATEPLPAGTYYVSFNIWSDTGAGAFSMYITSSDYVIINVLKNEQASGSGYTQSSPCSIVNSAFTVADGERFAIAVNVNGLRGGGVLHVTGATVCATQPTAYAPYAGTTIPFTLPTEHPYLAKLPDGTADEIVVDREGNVELVARVQKVDVSNLKSPSSAEVLNSGLTRFSYWNVLNVPAKQDSTAIAQILKNVIDYNFKTKGFYVSGLSIFAGSLTDPTEAFKASGYIYTILATPITYQLGKINLPVLPESTSNVWTDAEVTPRTGIEYTRDVNIVVANLESAIASITQG